MLKLIEVRKVFNAGRPNEHMAVAGVSVDLPSKQVTVLKGPSGSGKTTLLSLIGGMTRPTSGRIFLHDREITSLPERFLTTLRRQTFGFIFQQLHLIQGLTVLENVMLSAYPTGERHGALKIRAVRLLELFDLASKASARVEWLSGGEAQRVAMARALINNPGCIIADEPTAHLDTRLSLEFMDTVKRLKIQQKTILMASHDPLVYDSPAVDLVLEMRDGRILGQKER